MSKQPTLNFHCSVCGDAITEEIETVPSYDAMADSQSDAQGHEEQIVTCPSCQHQVRVGISNTGGGLTAELEDGGEVAIENDPIEHPDYLDDFEQYQSANVENDPARIFRYAVYDIEHVQSEMQEYPIKAVPRMLFVQYFSAIEAYLSDRLLGLVASDPQAMSSMVKNNKEWKDEKIPVAELAANPEALRDWVKKQLLSLIYHNFAKIDLYYIGAIGSSIFPDQEVKQTLLRLVPVRHNCVHRYGRDKDGNEHEIGDADLELLGRALQNMVLHIEAIFLRRG